MALNWDNWNDSMNPANSEHGEYCRCYSCEDGRKQERDARHRENARHTETFRYIVSDEWCATKSIFFNRVNESLINHLNLK